MRARLVWVAGLIAAPLPAAAGAPKPTKVDVAPFRDQLVVLQDAQGGSYLVLPGNSPRAFFAAKATFYEQIVVGRSANGDAWTVNTWAPRVDMVRPGSIQRNTDGTYAKWCGDAQTPLTVVSGDKAKQLIDKAAVMSPATVRVPHLLARDDAGIYYYVDALRKIYGGKGFRVFVGKKGGMKQVPLADIASDASGEVFATKTGELRLVHAENSPSTVGAATWIRGEKKQALTVLDNDTNSPLIFGDLGIYDFIGTLCDDLP